VQFANKDVGSNDIEQFDKVFWAFGPSIRGFKHCRPVICVDGTHLYSKYQGVLLIAMGIDAEGQIYPLAYAIVEKEDGENWSWFMCCLRVYVTEPSKGVGSLCVISDRHGGIIAAMKEDGSGWQEPRAFHRYCIRHHASNINTKYKSMKLKKLFEYTANEHQTIKWEEGMKKIGELNEGCKNVLEHLPKEKWSIAHDGGYRYGIKTSNHVEYFNGVLKSVRCLPISALVMATFYRVNSYFFARRESIKHKMLAGQLFSDSVLAKIESNIKAAGQHQVDRYNREEGLYGVITGRRKIAHTVNLSNRTCTCNKWQIYHYPCSHLLAVCSNENIPYARFVDPFYFMEQYKLSYQPSFRPVAPQRNWRPWSGKKLVPDPSLKRGDGRPKSTRIQNEMDNPSQGERTDNPSKEKRRKTCSVCKGVGHNRLTCVLKASTSST